MKEGDLVRNRYRILAPIAEGGFGAVYRAEDTVLMQPCAIKENLQPSEIAKQQFKSEASLLAGIHHQSLPRVTDHFEENDSQYLVMDYVTGDSLQKKLGKVTESEAVDWISQVGRALAYLHGKTPPIYHRDIKPANIIVQRDGRAVLVDFGIAKMMESTELTQLGAKAVTAGYSPPEQYSGTTDGRSDIYALGATLYALLVGHRPPVAIERLQGEQLAFTGVSTQLATLVQKAMRLNANERFDTMAQFVAALADSEQNNIDAANTDVDTDVSAKDGSAKKTSSTKYFLLGIMIGIFLLFLISCVLITVWLFRLFAPLMLM